MKVQDSCQLFLVTGGLGISFQVKKEKEKKNNRAKSKSNFSLIRWFLTGTDCQRIWFQLSQQTVFKNWLGQHWATRRPQPPQWLNISMNGMRREPNQVSEPGEGTTSWLTHPQSCNDVHPKYTFWYLSSWSTPPPSHINLVDNGVYLRWWFQKRHPNLVQRTLILLGLG